MPDAVIRPNQEELESILQYARLAPSSHNTQPWQVAYTREGLTVGYDPARQLTVADPSKRELFISLGCFIECLIKAAEDLGWVADYSFTGETPGQVARVIFKRRQPPTKTVRLEHISNRRSDRRLYDQAPLTANQLKALRQLNCGAAHMWITSERADIDFLAQMTEQASLAIMSRQAFRDELAQWVRNNWTKQPDGMPGYSQGIPGPVSLLAKVVIKKTQQATKDQAKKDGTRIAHSAAIGLICCKQQSPRTWIDAGRIYMTACLLAAGYGLKTSGVTAAVISQDTNRQISQHFGLADSPVALLRFGIVKGAVRATPRRSVAALFAS